MFLKTKSYIITKEGKIIWLNSKSKKIKELNNA